MSSHIAAEHYIFCYFDSLNSSEIETAEIGVLPSGKTQTVGTWTLLQLFYFTILLAFCGSMFIKASGLFYYEPVLQSLC